LQLAYTSVDVIEKANAAADAALSLAGNYFSQGLMQKSDLLAMQVRKTELANQLQQARSSVRNASDYLCLLFNEDTGNRVLKPGEELLLLNDSAEQPAAYSESRKDLLAIDKSMIAHKKMMQSAGSKFLPRLNAFGSYELYDTKVLQTGAKGYFIGAQLSWNIFDGYQSIAGRERTSAEYLKAKAEADQFHSQSKMEFNKTGRQLRVADENVKLARAAFNQSQEAYRIRYNRFEQGLEKTSDLLNAEATMIQKELDYLQSVYEFNYTKLYLLFLSK
jgi:outer membrane protein TolC